MSQAKIAVLREARSMIASHKCTFICRAIEIVGFTNLAHYEVARDLREYVSDALGDNFTLDSWLHDKGLITSGEIVAATYENNMRATRLAWLDWMIAQLGTE